MGKRDQRQAEVLKWAIDTFGKEAISKRERAKRFLEEAIELAQAAGLERWEAKNLVEYVFNRPAGEIGQEVGGVMVTLMSFAVAHNISVKAEEDREVSRVLAIDPVVFRERHAAKKRAGV